MLLHGGNITKRKDNMKESSTKANKLFIMHSAKQIGKIKNDEERERQVTDLEQKAKKMGFSRDWTERTLEKQGAYGESYDILKQEAERMHSYINTLSLERSVNLWSEAVKKQEENEDPEPVKGSKTLTKKTQEKITINPTEKEIGAKHK